MAAIVDARRPLRLLVLLLVLLLAVVYAGRDLYEVLGISRDASSPEIKKAFRKLSLKVGLPGMTLASCSMRVAAS